MKPVKAALHEMKLLEVSWFESGPSAEEGMTYMAFPGQVAHFVFEYLNAPVSIKEIAEATVPVGAHDPQHLYYKTWGTETDYRFALGPLIKQQAIYSKTMVQRQSDKLIKGIAS